MNDFPRKKVDKAPRIDDKKTRRRKNYARRHTKNARPRAYLNACAEYNCAKIAPNGRWG